MPSSVRNLLSPGSVFLAEWQFARGIIRKKFFVVVHLDQSHDCVYAFVTTSQLQFFKENPRIECEIVRIEPGRFSSFTKETAVDCRNAYRIDVAKLERLRREGKLILKGELPNAIMQKVIDTVRSSRVLPRKLKRLLVP